VCAEAGGLTNLIRNGQTGLFFQPGDADDLARQVGRLLGDAEFRRSLGEAARRETVRWDWSAATSQLRNQHYRLAEQRFAERTARAPPNLEPHGRRC
jgi:sulfoquinovosyltransferase